jgi:hypothetical protein
MYRAHVPNDDDTWARYIWPLQIMLDFSKPISYNVTNKMKVTS